MSVRRFLCFEVVSLLLWVGLFQLHTTELRHGFAQSLRNLSLALDLKIAAALKLADSRCDLLKGFVAALSEKVSKISETKKAIDGANADLKEANEKYEELKTRLDNINKTIADIEAALKERCQTMGTSVALNKKITKAVDVYGKLRVEEESLRKLLAAKQAKVKELRSELASNEKIVATKAKDLEQGKKAKEELAARHLVLKADGEVNSGKG